MQNDFERYARQMLLPELGEFGQKKLSEAKVLVVGVGGLGCPISLYLAGVGIGHIVLVDSDVVSVNNLHRQVLYSENNVGESKVMLAKKRLQSLNSSIIVDAFDCPFDESNAESLIKNTDILVDACDNFVTRYLMSDICQKLNKTYVYGSICGMEGQVSVFSPKSKTTYRTLYPDSKNMLSMPHPTKAVLPMTPAVVGTVEATEVVKLVCGFGDTLEGKLWTVDLRNWHTNIIKLI